MHIKFHETKSNFKRVIGQTHIFCSFVAVQQKCIPLDLDNWLSETMSRNKGNTDWTQFHRGILLWLMWLYIWASELVMLHDIHPSVKVQMYIKFHKTKLNIKTITGQTRMYTSFTQFCSSWTEMYLSMGFLYVLASLTWSDLWKSNSTENRLITVLLFLL